MPDAKINGKATKPVPASVSAAIKRGVPKHMAFANGPKPKSGVKVS